uniref:GP-PDE domain-containing protein n=1 Tax=Corethron hystrix TaxID=216773 RepID=A0A7S1BC57_9STRA|mmetsp:Transcript_21422/g.48652  ORF Transcript_21422/g.48652 Transcript_21422/m.48652 type:complete len:527 (+) Transcript_21422:58-1638(+)
MGKFSLYVQYAQEANTDETVYIVPYSELASKISGGDGISRDGLIDLWNTEHAKASKAFEGVAEKMWSDIFAAIAAEKETYVSLPRDVLEIYVRCQDRDKVYELLQFLGQLGKNIQLNFDSLRKLLRKFDKKAHNVLHVSSELLPNLYSSNFVTGKFAIESSLDVIRDFLELDDVASSHSAPPDVDVPIVPSLAAKKDEMDWFRENVKKSDSKEMKTVVAHRGFHDIDDDSFIRPLENTLTAMEYAWVAGVSLCECDVGLTKDEQIILAHDIDFSRLSLDNYDNMSTKAVSELTLSDIIALPLKSGARPPLLVDVLRSAKAIGKHAKLVIEIKPGNSEIVEPLLHLFTRHKNLLEHVAVVMSFDLYIMKRLSESLAVLSIGTFLPRGSISSFYNPFGRQSTLVLPQSSMKKSNDGIFKMPSLFLITESNPSRPHQGMFADMTCSESREKVENALDDSSLDGVYIQYQEEMITKFEAGSSLKDMSLTYKIGVWGLRTDPDNFSTNKKLVANAGISYVNTDFPRSFFDS